MTEKSFWFEVGLLVVFVVAIILISQCKSVQAHPQISEEYQVELPNGIKFDWYPSEVKEKCPDLIKWDSSNEYYSSKQCALDFTRLKRYIKGRSMSFKFEGNPKELAEVELYEAHPNANANRRRQIYYRKRLTRKYGEPTAKYCGSKQDKNENQCVEYFWEVKDTQLMMHIAKVPEQQAYGIYFVWSKK